MTRIRATLLLLILLTAIGLAPADAALARVPAPAPTKAPEPTASAPAPQGTATRTPPALTPKQIMEGMSVADKVGQLFLVTFQGYDTSAESDIATLVRDYRVGGVALLPSNGNFRNVPVLTSPITPTADDHPDPAAQHASADRHAGECPPAPGAEPGPGDHPDGQPDSDRDDHPDDRPDGEAGKQGQAQGAAGACHSNPRRAAADRARLDGRR